MDTEMSNDRDADFSGHKNRTRSSRRIQYGRDELLLYRNCALARTRPVGLPEGLGIILDQNPSEGPCRYEMQTKAPENKKSRKRAKQQKNQSTDDSSTKPPALNETMESTTAPDVVVHKIKQTKNQLSVENDISTKAASKPDIPKSIPQNEGIVESKRLTETMTACSDIGEVSSARNEREAQTIEPKSRKKKKRTKKQKLALEKEINTKAESKPDIPKSNARNEEIIESKRFTETMAACDIGEVPSARNERETHTIEPEVRKNKRTKNQGVAVKYEMHSKARRKTEILESDVQNEGIIENKRRVDETLGACSKEDGVPEESFSLDDPVVYSDIEVDQGRTNDLCRLLKSRTKDTINPSEFDNSHVGKNTHSNAKDGIYCDNCTDEKEPATSFCTICNDFLCQICSKVHQRSKLSRHHQLVHGDDMPKEKLYKFDENTCDTHKGELRNMFCNQHKTLLCTVCVALHHKHCKVEYIPDIAKDFAESNEYKDLNKELITMIKDMGNYKQMISKNISAIEKSPTRLLQQISKFRVRINKVFDRVEHTTLNHLYSALTKYAEAFKQAHNTCSELETEVGDVLSKLERLENSQPVALVFLAKQVETRKENYDKTLEDVGSTATERKLKFFPNQQILEQLESFSDFGTFELEQNDIVEEELQAITTDVGSGRIVHGEDFNVQHPSDLKDCWITGSAVIGEDKLALVDRNNSSLKIVHIQQRKITSMLKLQVPAWDIANIDGQNFVMTCGNRLVFVHDHSRYLTTIDREFVVGGCTYGVACHRDLVYVSDLTQPQLIKVVSMEGVVVKTIFLESVLGLPVLPKYVSVTVDGKSLVLTDRNIVMCLNNNKIGPIELKLKSPFLLMDVSLDIDLTDLKSIGLFLFAGMSVAQIDREIVPLVELDKKPQTVCYCQKKGEIYVSFEQGSKKANVISVFYSLPKDDI